MAQSANSPGDPGPQDNWRTAWNDRQDEIDQSIYSALGEGRSIEDAYSDVRTTARQWLDTEVPDEGDFSARFREYYESRIEDMERGGAISRQENGSFYVNPEHAPGEGSGNRGTAMNRLAEGSTSSRSSSGSGDPADF